MGKSATEESPQVLGLCDLRPAKGAVRKKLRVGRGRASGSGKTCNRGHNGEGQRAGRSRKRGFEGGQMPGYRKVPKVDGFRLLNPSHWLVLNVGELTSRFSASETDITYAMLQSMGLLKSHHRGLRILGKGEISKKLTLQAHHVTPSALEKIEKAGGQVNIEKAPDAPKKKLKRALR